MITFYSVFLLIAKCTFWSMLDKDSPLRIHLKNSPFFQYTICLYSIHAELLAICQTCHILQTSVPLLEYFFLPIRKSLKDSSVHSQDVTSLGTFYHHRQLVPSLVSSLILSTWLVLSIHHTVIVVSVLLFHLHMNFCKVGSYKISSMHFFSRMPCICTKKLLIYIW